MESRFIVPKDMFRRKRNPVSFEKKIPSSIFAGHKDVIPDKILIKYEKDVNIQQLDEIIKYKYKKHRENRNELLLEVEKLKQKTGNDKKIKKIENDFYDYENNISINEYISKTKHLIHRYSIKKSDEILFNYFNIAERYIKIDKIKKIKTTFLCSGCGFDLKDSDENENGCYVCETCNCINDFLKINKYTRDTDQKVSPVDEDMNNFIKILDKFEGKFSTVIHNELYDFLDIFFTEIGDKDGEYYRNLPLLDNGKKKGTSKKKLWNALDKIGHSQYYDESSYICHVYWGWGLPDLSLYREQLLIDYQNTQKHWNMIKSDYNRSASLGTQYRLFVHLKAVDYPCCDIDDFKIQDMVESLRKHNHAWERMCKASNVNFFPVST